MLLAFFSVAPAPARAVPAFAAQTGQPCSACHIGGFGPALTPYGRDFKLKGYTARAVKWNVPLSIMVISSYVHTKAAQSGGAAPGYGENDNFSLDQVGLFLAGGVGQHLGGLVQGTYDGVGKAWSWDNADLRAVVQTTVGGADVVFGTSLNNNPTVQDVWNTLPAWGYPYTGTALAPHPAAAPLLSGGFAQRVIGLSGYAWINSRVYLEGGAYGSLHRRALNDLGIDPTSPGNIEDLAPYGRIAFEHPFGSATVQVGAFGMQAHLHPGLDTTTNTTDRYTDLGLDASYQRVRANSDVVAANARYIHEAQSLYASYLLGNVDHPDNTLEDVRFDIAYYFRNRFGGTFGLFDTFGSADPLLYANNLGFKPNSSGATLQIDGTLYPNGGSPLGKRFNLRAGIQFTAYNKFDGGRTNFDGSGRNASDNNTTRIFLWLAY